MWIGEHRIWEKETRFSFCWKLNAITIQLHPERRRECESAALSPVRVYNSPGNNRNVICMVWFGDICICTTSGLNAITELQLLNQLLCGDCCIFEILHKFGTESTLADRNIVLVNSGSRLQNFFVNWNMNQQISWEWEKEREGWTEMQGWSILWSKAFRHENYPKCISI